MASSRALVTFALASLCVACTATDAPEGKDVTVTGRVGPTLRIDARGAHVLVALSRFAVFEGHLGKGESLVTKGEAKGFELALATSPISVSSVRATLPADAAGPLRIARADAAEAWLEIRALDVDAVEGEPVEGAVVYEGARPGTDVALVAEPGRVEELRLLHAPEARPVARYAIRSGPAVTALRVREGRVEAVDAAGRVLLATEPAFAVDARGTRRDVEARITKEDDATILSLSFDATGLVPPIAVDPVWAATPAMSSARAQAVGVALPGSKVLVAGGAAGSLVHSSAEVYDASSNTWAPTASLSLPRANAAAIALSTGKVLVAGGRTSGSTHTSGAEAWDPIAGTWSPAGAMATAREGAAVASLGGTKVLVVGGSDGATSLSTAEIYDAATNAWTNAAPLAARRTHHVAVPLSAGKVLVAGGAEPLSNAEIYDAATNAWAIAPFMQAPRGGHAAVKLSDGRVLVSGGGTVSSNVSVSTAEVYDPVTGTWTLVASMKARRMYHSATLLPSGRVLVAGGSYGSSAISSSEVYDPATNTWTLAGNALAPRTGHVAAAAGTGALVAGGKSSTSTTTGLSTAEIFTPGAPGATCSLASDCATGFCVDGVCCDKACTGSCEACNESGKAGSCTPVTGTPRGTRARCDTGGGDVCKARTCDGVEPSTCAGYLNGPTRSCGSASCSIDLFLAAGKCDGAGTCVTAAPLACAPFRCTSSGCRTSCTTNSHCATGNRCTGGTCVPADTCSADGLSIQKTDGSLVSCAPYRCLSSSATCSTSCSSNASCATGAICNTAARQCVGGGGGSSSGCDCHVGRSDRATAHLAPLAGLGLLAFASRLASRVRARTRRGR